VTIFMLYSRYSMTDYRIVFLELSCRFSNSADESLEF
jgi:hypothetical protein